MTQQQPNIKEAYILFSSDWSDPISLFRRRKSRYRKTLKKHGQAFKREAIRMIHDGQSLASFARKFGVSEGLLHNWKKEAVETASDSERELIELMKRLREVDMESNNLRMAALIFGRSG